MNKNIKSKIKEAITKFYNKSFLVEETQCWIWQGARTQLGYPMHSLPMDIRPYICGGHSGMFSAGSKPAHRISYLISGKTIPEGYDVDHICNNPLCVNPDHLQAVSHQTNIDLRELRRKVKK
jgi:hypothetical protein